MTMRLRSGSDDSQQSPHTTIIDFSGNDTGDGDFNLDRWLAKYKSKGSNIWTGRDSPTYWKQNEQSWSDDVTVAGIGGAWQAGESLTVNAGYYSLPVGMHHFSGNMVLGQLVYKQDIGNNALTLAGGLLYIDADPDNKHGEKLLDGNGSRDYATWIGSVQYRMNLSKKPLALGIDYMHNSEDYDKDDEDAYTAHHYDQTNGYVLSVLYGGTSNPGDWLYGYYYNDIQTFAVSSSYAQDNFPRWGTSAESRATNFNGHEFRLGYGVKENIDIITRLYLVEGNIRRSATATHLEDGDRFRIDLNIKF